ncbi:MAG: outer membrane beta-barrel protein [Parvularculaceae bacterium]|nr:outer membrane beta-barrel protein [Parvularculaceae bacterium]
MKRITCAAVIVLLASPVSAQPICIENAEGSLLCGKDAEREKERIRTEVAARQGAAPQVKQAKSEPRAGSVYDGFSRRAFVRGGTAFAGGGADFGNNIVGSAGANFAIGRSGLSVETELLILRDSETFSDPFFGTFTAKALALAGLVGLRYDLDTGSPVNPFASVGIGPGYLRATLDDGVSSITADDFTFAYSGRAGLTVDVTERFGFEAAYRYLDTSQSGASAQHSVELGLNLGF